jgi:colanic acid biosynthesis glycosyl transferase WcaI
MKMNIIVWGINYAPEVAGIGPYNTALCRFLAEQGHDVRMVTSFPYYPGWRKAATDKGRLYRTDHDNSIAVHRCWHFVPSAPTTIKRILHEASFVFFSLLRLLFLPRPDVFVVVSPPLLLGAAAWLLSIVKRSPYILHVQDLQPDAAVGMGMLKPGLLIHSLYRLEALAYRKANRVSGISQGMCIAFKTKGTPPAKIVYFPNGVELGAKAPVAGDFRKRIGASRKDFIAVYSGNLGVKQGLDVLIEAARLIRASDIRLVICGEGARRDYLVGQVAKYELPNVTMLPLQAQHHYEEMLADANVCLITQQKGSGASFLPSKLLSHLAFSKPVLSVADRSSALASALETGRFGINIEPGNPKRIALELESMSQNRTQLASYAEAGSRYVRQFDLRRVLAAFEAELLALAAETNSAKIGNKPGSSKSPAPEFAEV